MGAKFREIGVRFHHFYLVLNFPGDRKMVENYRQNEVQFHNVYLVLNSLYDIKMEANSPLLFNTKFYSWHQNGNKFKTKSVSYWLLLVLIFSNIDITMDANFKQNDVKFHHCYLVQNFTYHIKIKPSTFITHLFKHWHWNGGNYKTKWRSIAFTTFST